MSIEGSFAGVDQSQRAYAPTVGTTPTNFSHIDVRDPTPNDVYYYLGKWWLNTVTPSLWYLNNFTTISGFLQANWVMIATTPGLLQTLTGNDLNVVVPSGANINIFGRTVAAGTHAIPLFTTKFALSQMDIDLQVASAQAGSDINNAGIASFSNSQFAVDANGFVTLSGGGATINKVGVDTSSGTGTNPVVPDGANEIFVTGNQVAAGVVNPNVIRTDSLAPNTYTIEIQRSQAVAASTIGDNGVSHFSDAQFTVDANGFVQLAGGPAPPTLGIVVDAFTAPGDSPVHPDGSGNITITGGQVAAGTTTNVIRTDSTAADGANKFTIEIQRSQAVGVSTVGDNGVSHFDSSRFTVDGNGFVSINGAGVGETITGDSGGALSPTAGNWNIFGRSGSKTAGAGSTLTINSPPYSNQGGTTTVTLNSGSFATAAITLSLPVSAGLLDGDLCEFVCTTALALQIKAAAGQTIRIGSLISSVAGTATSTLIGDSVSLRFRAADQIWYATSVIGTWLMA